MSQTSPPSNFSSATYDDKDRLLTYGDADYTYTANGELQSKTEDGETTTYEYDFLDNLRRVVLPDQTEIEYVIDGHNPRIGKKVDGALMQGFLYEDQLNPAAELDGSGNVVSRFVYGTKPNVPDYMIRYDSQGQPTGTYRIVSDHLGSVRLVINSNNGNVAQRIDYDEWGGATLIAGTWDVQPFGFAGGLYDPSTKFVRFGARDYDPQSGRWATKDPAGFGGGDPNLFVYVWNDPVDTIDPSGLREGGFQRTLDHLKCIAGCVQDDTTFKKISKTCKQFYLSCVNACGGVPQCIAAVCWPMSIVCKVVQGGAGLSAFPECARSCLEPGACDTPPPPMPSPSAGSSPQPER